MKSTTYSQNKSETLTGYDLSTSRRLTDGELVSLYTLADTASRTRPLKKQSFAYVIAYCDLMDAANGHCILDPIAVKNINDQLGLSVPQGRIAQPGALSKHISMKNGVPLTAPTTRKN